MKKILLIALMSFYFASPVQSQLLYNSTWDVYNASNVLTNRIHFSADTIFYSSNLTSFYPLSKYTINENRITFVDIPNAPKSCSNAEAGRYTFSVQSDSLLFKLLSDPCNNRSDEITQFSYVRNSTNIQIVSDEPTVVVFPNPSIDGLYYLRISNNNAGFDRLSVYTSDSKLIIEEKIPFEGLPEYTLNLTDFPQGIYLLTLHGTNGNKIIKLLRSK